MEGFVVVQNLQVAVYFWLRNNFINRSSFCFHKSHGHSQINLNEIEISLFEIKYLIYIIVHK